MYTQLQWRATAQPEKSCARITTIHRLVEGGLLFLPSHLPSRNLFQRDSDLSSVYSYYKLVTLTKQSYKERKRSTSLVKKLLLLDSASREGVPRGPRVTAGGREADDTVGVQAATAASHGIGPTGVGVSGNISTAISRGLAGVYTLTPHTHARSQWVRKLWSESTRPSQKRVTG